MARKLKYMKFQKIQKQKSVLIIFLLVVDQDNLLRHWQLLAFNHLVIMSKVTG